MDFSEAARRYTELQVQRQNGSLSDQQYRTLIDQLRVTDEKGIWWQPDPGRTGWIFWNGTQWQPGTPPLPVHTAPSFQPQQSSSTRGYPGAHADDKKIMDTGTFREIARTTPWNKRPQKWWDLFAILVGVVSAIIWLLYSGAPKTSEGVDFISIILMIGIPFVLVIYRAKIDAYLVGLQPYRHRFSKIVLIGMGLAAPYLTAFILFNVLGIRNYPLMYWNLILGTAVSYAIMREPVLAPGYQPTRGPNMKIPIILFLIGSLLIRIVAADHCLSDPLNAQDCERSSGFAEGISGTPAAVLSAGANGQSIVQSLQGGEGGEGGNAEGGGQSDGGLEDGGQNHGGFNDNPNTEFSGGQGPGGC